MKEIVSTLYFALFCFLFSGIQFALNWGGEGIVSPETEQWGYYLGMACMAFGFLLCGLFAKARADRDKNGLPALTGLCAALGAGLMLLFFCPGPPVYLPGIGLLFFLLGILGGSVYHRMAMGLKDSGHRGLIIGAGSALGTILHQIFFNTLGKEPVLVLLLLFLALLPAVQHFAFPEEIPTHRFSQPAPQDAKGLCDGQRELLRLLLILGCLFLMNGIYDNWLELLQTSSGRTAGFHALSWPRYLLGPVYLLFGLLCDRFGKKGISLTVLCVSFTAVLMPAFVGADEPMSAMVVFYLLAGSTVAYMNQMLIGLSPYVPGSVFWVVSGRIADNLIGLLTGLFRLSGLGLFPIIGLDLTAFCVITICMFLNGYLSNDKSASSPGAGGEGVSASPDPETFACRFGLTEREKDVLLLLLYSEDTGETIADKLQISRRHVQRNIASIYQKTGTQTRAGLVRRFYEQSELPLS